MSIGVVRVCTTCRWSTRLAEWIDSHLLRLQYLLCLQKPVTSCFWRGQRISELDCESAISVQLFGNKNAVVFFDRMEQNLKKKILCPNLGWGKKNIIDCDNLPNISSHSNTGSALIVDLSHCTNQTPQLSISLIPLNGVFQRWSGKASLLTASWSFGWLGEARR